MIMITKRKFQLSLKNRVYLLNAILLCITLIGAMLMIWYTYKTEKIFREIVDRNVVIFQSAEALSTSLVNQKGFISYYLLDGDPAWIGELKQYMSLFEEHLATVKSLVQEKWEKDAVAQIQAEYDYCVMTKNKVIELYDAGKTQKGARLHKDAKAHFARIFELCDQFNSFHKDKISQAINTSRTESNHLRYIALMAVITVIVLSLLINYIFNRHILDPIRKLAAEAHGQGCNAPVANEVTALKESVYGLMENAEQTHQELKRSQETLMQSEKMALVGKLAAGTAHSIRNPLTSVKMRLFSLNRSCSFTEAQQEDFNVISGEIKQINKILENFLEFARPPRLKTIMKSPSVVVDSALNLLKQRLKSYQVAASIVRKRPLQKTLIDPEQLKEVVVNIIINACEAMEGGGIIAVHEAEQYIEPLKKVDVITITDNGPGIPQEIKGEVFNPFFTTKDDGTGLGLNIAFNIISQHGGWLDVKSREGEGASFIITLPVKDI
ncbi:sensor histidine kinase [Desulfocicer vacuolatum]|nr:ATP-binding protein [Desulfocicer vacuolatum]